MQTRKKIQNILLFGLSYHTMTIFSVDGIGYIPPKSFLKGTSPHLKIIAFSYIHSVVLEICRRVNHLIVGNINLSNKVQKGFDLIVQSLFFFVGFIHSQTKLQNLFHLFKPRFGALLGFLRFFLVIHKSGGVSHRRPFHPTLTSVRIDFLVTMILKVKTRILV